MKNSLAGVSSRSRGNDSLFDIDSGRVLGDQFSEPPEVMSRSA
jgi:hypothetical protein